jgi:hypothetical protein
MFLILMVLHNVELLDDLLQAWEDCGVSGVTILQSSGLAQLKQANILRDDFPLIPSLEDIMDHTENNNRTLFTVVKDENLVDKVVCATQHITGDLNLPHTGILVVVPVLQAYGLDRRR